MFCHFVLQFRQWHNNNRPVIIVIYSPRGHTVSVIFILFFLLHFTYFFYVFDKNINSLSPCYPVIGNPCFHPFRFYVPVCTNVRIYEFFSFFTCSPSTVKISPLNGIQLGWCSTSKVRASFCVCVI